MWINKNINQLTNRIIEYKEINYYYFKKNIKKIYNNNIKMSIYFILIKKYNISIIIKFYILTLIKE